MLRGGVVSTAEVVITALLGSLWEDKAKEGGQLRGSLLLRSDAGFVAFHTLWSLKTSVQSMCHMSKLPDYHVAFNAMSFLGSRDELL